MAEGHDRRRFLSELLRGASRAAGELGAVADAARDPGETGETVLAAGGILFDPEALQRATQPAEPAQRLATAEELAACCAEVGIGAWAAEAAALAQTSLRLTPGSGGRSRLGGPPDVPPGFEWPVWQQEELTLLAQLQLDELPPSPLPPDGALLVFHALAAAPSGGQPSHAGACRVVLVRDEPVVPLARDEALPSVPLVASAELTLPAEPASLVLDADAFDLWTELRARLAAIHGVELDERSSGHHALHRLLGYPDTIAGTMGADAELVSHGIDVDAGDHYLDPRAEELEARAGEWQLLLELSRDDDAGVTLGHGERLYVWIRERDLRAARFDDVRAFVR